MKNSKSLRRWERLLRFHRTNGPWLTSWQQLMGIGSVTPSKVRHEATLAGWAWKTRTNQNGHTEYRPVRAAGTCCERDRSGRVAR